MVRAGWLPTMVFFLAAFVGLIVLIAFSVMKTNDLYREALTGEGFGRGR